MIDIIEIKIEEFKEKIYDKYVKLFPEEEQRNWKKIENTYKKGIERFYKIVLENKDIGFFMLEKIDNLPYYIDYFAIYKEYQNNGYGTRAIEKLIEKVQNDEIIGEIEKENNENINTIKRFEFYERLGFRKFGSEYLLYDVYFIPIVFSISKKIDKEKYDKIFFEYYKTNCGEDDVKTKCFIKK